MSENKNPLFLAVIAKNKNLSEKEILAALIPYNIVNAHLENFTLITGEAKGVDIPIESVSIPEIYLHMIFSKGAWEGNGIQVPVYDVNGEKSRTITARFAKDTRLTIEDLFVYEHELADIEREYPDIFTEKPATSPQAEEPLSPKLEDSLYALIGIFLDILVDKKGKNLLPNPNDDNKYSFQSQGELIEYIEKYELPYGLKKSSLQDKFGKANSTLHKKLTS